MSTDPLFMRDNTGEYFWYHNDHLGTPQMMTTSSGAVVWKAEYTSFGKATVDPSSTVDNPLRLPGQYEDDETGMHYNWWRYYQPNIGRYLQSDPIGFWGGINLFAYVFNNPANLVDPYGLETLVPTIPTAPPVVGHPVFRPGTPENDIIVEDTKRLFKKLHDVLEVVLLSRLSPFLMARGKKDQDPQWVKDLPKEYDPGRYPDGRCKPCKKPKPFKHPEQETHPCKGHQIVYRQDPVSCKCYARRIDF